MVGGGCLFLVLRTAIGSPVDSATWVELAALKPLTDFYRHVLAFVEAGDARQGLALEKFQGGPATGRYV
ncbi:hypothetical protein NKDENANG_00374 [Candidatus Entotheonellaceae bacterium PAL068K]